MTFEVRVQTDAEAVRLKLRALIDDQIPFATAVALTRTAQAARRAMRKRLPQAFKVRARRRILGTEERGGTVRVQRAERRDWPRVRSTVGVLDDFVARHEKGGRQRPTRARTFAVPSRLIRRTSTGSIQKTRRPRSLIQSGRATVTQRRRVREQRARKGRGRAKNLGKRGILYFLVRSITLRPRLRFRQTVTRAAETVYGREFTKAYRKAVETAKRR